MLSLRGRSLDITITVPLILLLNVAAPVYVVVLENVVAIELIISVEFIYMIFAPVLPLKYKVSKLSNNLKVISFVTDIRVSSEDEEIGLDMSEHNEQGYNL
mgnify:CR=1 FL=1